MKVSFVIPTYNSINMVTKDCVGTFEKFHGKGHEIIIVDDGSDNNTCFQLSSFCTNNGYKFLHNEKNSGFSKTVNRGIAESTGDIVVLLNNDIVFTQAVISDIVEAFQSDEKIGIVGGLLFYPNGTIQHGGVSWIPGSHQFIHRAWHKHLKDAPEVTQKSYMVSVTGALYAIRKTMVDQIGKLKEEYFISCEDTEYSLRAWTSGWRVFYNPKIRAIHAEGGTRGRTDQEKLIKGREWYIKELSTMGKFNEDLARLDINKIQRLSNEANIEMLNRDAKKNPSVSQSHPAGLESANQKPVTKTVSKKIAIRRTGAMGDALLASGVIRRLKELRPDISVSVATHSPEVFRNNPHVDMVARSIFDLSAEEFYDLDLAYEKRPKAPVVDAYADIILGSEEKGDLRPEMYSFESDLDSVRQKLKGINLDAEHIVVVHAARSWENRTWPREKWLNVCRSLSSQVKVVVVGRGSDFSMDMYNGVYNMIDRFTIFEIRELIKKAKCFVGMDSGLFHVAQTTDTPCVGLFTVANPAYRVTRLTNTVTLVPTSECKFCLHENQPPVTFTDCNWKSGPERFKCLNEITVDSVINAVRVASSLV